MTAIATELKAEAEAKAIAIAAYRKRKKFGWFDAQTTFFYNSYSHNYINI